MIATGLSKLLTDQATLLRNRRVGLVTHPPAVTPDLISAVDALRKAGVNVTALFGPEHGLSGAVADGASVSNARDRHTRLPIFSLYGSTKEPTAAMLADVDVLVFDMQDIGARFYTYLSTLYYVLCGAAHHTRSVIVLDRPNPIGGTRTEGPLVAPGYESFVGIAPIPIRHGLTMGELARYFNAEFHLNADLTVVPLRGWLRSMWFDETGLPWVPTSPALPHLSTATVYPGMCLIEGTNLSEGRGTALPFEITGAPWLDGDALARSLNQLDLPGVRFRPIAFEPSASKHAGKMCAGVQMHVIDRVTFEPLTTGLHVIAAARAQQPDRFKFHPDGFDRLYGSARGRELIEAGEAITPEWAAEAEQFSAATQAHWLYPL